jgi:hypothetical protein
MRTTIARVTAMLATVPIALVLTASAAQAQPREVIIGPVTVCSVITFFDTVIFEYDCHTEG